MRLLLYYTQILNLYLFDHNLTKKYLNNTFNLGKGDSKGSSGIGIPALQSWLSCYIPYKLQLRPHGSHMSKNGGWGKQGHREIISLRQQNFIEIISVQQS